jgi:hypothetical protein
MAASSTPDGIDQTAPRLQSSQHLLLPFPSLTLSPFPRASRCVRTHTHTHTCGRARRLVLCREFLHRLGYACRFPKSTVVMRSLHRAPLRMGERSPEWGCRRNPTGSPTRLGDSAHGSLLIAYTLCRYVTLCVALLCAYGVCVCTEYSAESHIPGEVDCAARPAIPVGAKL